MVNKGLHDPSRTGNIANSIRLDPETEQRINSLASQTGRTKAFYMRQMVESQLGEVEEYYLAADALERVRQGKERVYCSAEVREDLELND
ncbi:MAG: CopG family transcriptional regulator [Bryobacterales bacterium]|nr:CopG family transcriptional regulator [Bryobacterales bacterium]